MTPTTLTATSDREKSHRASQWKSTIRSGVSLVLLLVTLCTVGAPASAREAAFLDPGASSGGVSEEAVKVDPKAEIDIGETILNVAKRASVFFVNQTNMLVKIEKLSVNSDSNVVAESTANDCAKQGAIAPMSRCSVEVSVTATSPGTWSVDVLMTHNGSGRLTRARITGKTSGSGTGDNKSSGLAVNTKDSKPIDFGEVIVGDGKIVRSTLMVNDSAEPITVYAIDVIEADNGLQRLEQGCAVDMELAPGSSCPVTLLWVPKTNGPVSTDLIIRHSGKLGFAVIPIRGMAKGGSSASGSSTEVKTDGKASSGGKKDSVPPPPSAQDLEKAMAGRVAQITEAALSGPSASRSAPVSSGGDGSMHLIGTIGDRALILKPSGETQVVPTGGEVDLFDKTVKIIAVGPHSADIVVDGKKKTLQLEAASSLVSRAAEMSKRTDDSQQKGGSSRSGSSSGGVRK